jgi:hypothetical protein
MRCLLVGLTLLVAARVPAHSDDLAPPPPAIETEVRPLLKLARGTRLRMHLADGRQRIITGRLQDADGRSVTVDMGGGRSQRFSRDGLRQVEYRVGGRDRRRGGKIGATITGLVGFVACLVAWERASSDVSGQGGGSICALASFVAAAPGFGIGFAIGAPDGHWGKAKPDGWTVSGAAPSRRATVAVHLSPGR